MPTATRRYLLAPPPKAHIFGTRSRRRPVSRPWETEPPPPPKRGPLFTFTLLRGPAGRRRGPNRYIIVWSSYASSPPPPTPTRPDPIHRAQKHHLYQPTVMGGARHGDGGMTEVLRRQSESIRGHFEQCEGFPADSLFSASIDFGKKQNNCGAGRGVGQYFNRL